MPPVEYREEPCGAALSRIKGAPWMVPWSLNPYTGCAHRCTFCYVRAFERRADRPSDDRYGASIRVKVNIADRLRLELRAPKWQREAVAIGTATDPYQPAEGTYRLTRRCLELLANARTPFHIITRGPLIVRDIDVLQHAARRAEVAVNFSVPTLDRDVWRTTEPSTAPPRQRLRALARLVDAGIDTGVSLAPILPGLSDRPSQIEAVIRAARDAGATRVWSGALNLRPGTREHFLECLARDWPEQLPRYLELYDRPYLPDAHVKAIQQTVSSLENRYAITDRRPNPIQVERELEQLALGI